jgi:hypothetical protein
MSRVEDGDDTRMAERLAQARKADESNKAKKSTESNAFSKLVGQQKQQAQVGKEQVQHQSTMAQLLGDAEALALHESGHTEAQAQSQQAESGFKSKLGQKSLGEKVSQNTKADGNRAQGERIKDAQGEGATAQSRTADQSASSRGTDSRRTEGKATNSKIAERSESNEASSTQAASAGAAKGEKGDIKTDADKGGGGQQGQGNKDAPAMQPGFRFNPALMAPMGIAKQKPTTGSDRLAKVANEIAQKIVENVRVGTNAMGAMEFQVDLRGDVLSGLSMKISAKNGKIKAVFSGNDRDVLKMIEEQKEGLQLALSARGLTLEDFKTETR